jgi:uncharacterized membrane protein YdfJ with MMPL/SSD domain
VVFGVVAGLAFGVLMLACRSIALPLLSIALKAFAKRYAQGMTSVDALTSRMATSVGVVTSAAVIMVAVFTLSLVDIKTLGIGLAIAVLINATAVRGILIPAAMVVLRERTWYMPRWLGF